MQLTRLAFGLMALSFLCSSPQLAAQDKSPESPVNAPAPAAPKLTSEVRVAPGVLQGTLLSAKDRQPIGAHSMTLVDASGKAETITATKDGVYQTRKLAPGSYSLQVRSDLQLDLVVADGATTRQLDILVPQQSPAKQNPQQPQVSPRPTRLVPQDPSKVPAAPGGAAPVTQLPAAGLSTGTWALIGAGATAAVAVPVVAAQRNSSTPVSPVQPLNGQLGR